MYRVTIKDGIQGLQKKFSNDLNATGIRRLAKEVNQKATEGAVSAARRQLVRDIPGYKENVDQIVARRRGDGNRVFISREPSARRAALIGLYVTGGTVSFPDSVIGNYLIRVDRRFSARRIYQLIQYAYAGHLESASYTSEDYKLWVNRSIDGKHYALLKNQRGIFLIERFGRYKSVFAPSETARTGRISKRGQRSSRLIAMMPASVTFKPRFKMELAVNRYISQQSNRIIARCAEPLLGNRRYALQKR